MSQDHTKRPHVADTALGRFCAYQHGKKHGKTIDNIKFSQLLRLVWIDACLDQGGVNRSDLTAAFGISGQQASYDFAAFKALYPRQLDYNPTARKYIRHRDCAKVFPAELHHQIKAIVGTVAALR